MSWYVKYLLSNTGEIRGYFEEGVDGFDDPVYSDLLFLESEVDRLLKLEIFTKTELLVLEQIRKGFNFSDIGKQLNLSRVTVSKAFDSLCDKISFTLGNQYTDDGFVDTILSDYTIVDEERYDKLVRKIYE